MSHPPADHSVASLLRQYSTEDKEGCLEVLRGPYRGQIFLQGGRIIHADYLGKRGLSALYELLPWDEVTFQWYAGMKPGAPTFNLSLAELEVQDTGEAVSLNDIPVAYTPLPPELLDEDPAVSLYHQELESTLLGNHIICLDWNKAPGGPQNFRFEGKIQSGCVMGSGEDCQFVLHHPSVEPLHCSLMIHADYVEVWDLGTADKTLVNGVVVEQSVLTSGDTLQLGEVELLFTLRVRRRFQNDEAGFSSEVTIPAPKKSHDGTIPKKAISYATLAAKSRSKPGVSKALRKLFFRSTQHVKHKPS